VQHRFEELRVRAEPVINVIQFGAARSRGYESFRRGYASGWFVEKSWIEVRLSVPWIVEVRRVGAPDAMVCKDVDQAPEVIFATVWIKILIVIESRYVQLAGRPLGAVHVCILSIAVRRPTSTCVYEPRNRIAKIESDAHRPYR